MMWRRSAVECQACGYRWEHVAPVDEPDDGLECPTCGQMAGSVPTVDEYEKWAGYMFKGNEP